MGNVSTSTGRQSLCVAPGFKELHQNKKNKLIASIQNAIKNGETGITISYLDLLVDNPNKDVYDDYLIEPSEVKKIMNEIICHPYTVENNKVMSGNVIFYNMSSLKILFVFGMPSVIMPSLPNENTVHVPQIKQTDNWHSVETSTSHNLSDEDIAIIPS